MLAYLIAMVSVGVRFARKQTGTEAYFVASRSIPSWAMGMSLVATLITQRDVHGLSRLGVRQETGAC